MRYAVLIALAAAVVAAVLVLRRRRARGWPPGTLGLPLVGEMLPLLLDTHGFFLRRARRHGPVFRTHLFGGPMAVFSGPEALHFLLTSPDVDRNGAGLGSVRKLFLDDVLPLLDGPEHLRRKSVFLEAFRAEALDARLPVVQRVIERFVESWAQQGEFVWRPEHEKLAFALAHELVTGRAPDPEAAPLHGALNDFLLGFTALPVALPFTRFGRALRARDRVLAYLRRELAAPAGLLAELDAARDAQGRPFGPSLPVEALHVYFAAYSGLYAALIVLCLFLGRSPEHRRAVVDEVRRVTPTGPLTADQMARLEVLERFTVEARRVHPLNPMTFVTRVVRPLRFGGFEIPAGWRALGALYATMQDPATWPDPQRFDPDRSAPRCPAHARADAFAAHGAGPPEGHRCGGEPLVTLVMKAAGALLVRDHAWEFPEQDLAPNREFFPMPRSGLRVRFFRRPTAPGTPPEVA